MVPVNELYFIAALTSMRHVQILTLEEKRKKKGRNKRNKKGRKKHTKKAKDLSKMCRKAKIKARSLTLECHVQAEAGNGAAAGSAGGAAPSACSSRRCRAAAAGAGQGRGSCARRRGCSPQGEWLPLKRETPTGTASHPDCSNRMSAGYCMKGIWLPDSRVCLRLL